MYIKGDHWVICDRCGFKYRFSQMRETWDGLWVCEEDWEPKHPQLSVKGKEDDQRVLVTRPDKDCILGTTTLAAAASADTKQLVLTAVTGLDDGESIGVTLDDDTVQWVSLDGDPFSLNTPIIHYKLDESSGNVCTDTSGYSNGTVAGVGGSADWVAGQIDNALNLDGSDDYVTVNDTLQSTFQAAFSISTYINMDDGNPAAAEYIFGVENSTDWVAVYVGTAGQLYAAYSANGNSTSIGSDNAFADGATGYKHLVVSFGSDEIRLFLSETTLQPTFNNGSMLGITMSDYASSLNPYIAASNANGTDTYHLDGKFDDFRIYDQAIDTEEKASLVYTNTGSVVKISDYLWGAAASGNTVYLSSSADVSFSSTVSADDL